MYGVCMPNETENEKNSTNGMFKVAYGQNVADHSVYSSFDTQIIVDDILYSIFRNEIPFEKCSTKCSPFFGVKKIDEKKARMAT